MENDLPDRNSLRWMMRVVEERASFLGHKHTHRANNEGGMEKNRLYEEQEEQREGRKGRDVP